MLGISASDFFCPNLATLAQLLGLDENVAGVTFLAFGNGSPDVFATFSAMRTNSGSLAIGELLGAASFIVSCVVGSMCIIKPFKVNRGPFLRDIGFFTVAVATFLFILMDGSIRAWEAGLLIALYLVYVCAVVVGSWWDRRQERLRARDAQIRNQFATEEVPQAPYRDEEPCRDELDDGEGIPVPLISHTPASPTSEIDGEAPPAKASRRQYILHILARTFHILFPTLHDLRSKTVLGKIASVFAAPAVFVLTLTLPVMVTPYDSGHFHLEKPGTDERLIAFEEDGIERALIAEEIVEEELHELRFNKWLMAAQCTFGPLFCTAVLFKNTHHEGWLLLATGIAGLAGGTLIAIFAENGDHPTSHMARCSMGFLVAMVWIMAIADEVVYVLQTFGFIFGLSDAIIGLTIFAIGNSLADLVANMSVAVFAPVMGFSACFGGPMLNMLLGVGISGSYIIHQTGESYNLEFSTTLFVSAIGLLFLLLVTMIFIPLNGYYLPRLWGFFLIFSYTVIMAINIIVEVAGLRDKSK
ncbi:hypothetical protein EWM64_g6097 [Hericium alpestre]|uniref:Sodium/calcium exchanger membrane region domain-containing protein n=2 Tax=Hericium alpestre TaxID=135208 RepID=A0A4Y9ZV49_9AGAM|nr:hypothetical protein EWM64_g6097 [Hericium alpestre]